MKKVNFLIASLILTGLINSCYTHSKITLNQVDNMSYRLRRT